MTPVITVEDVEAYRAVHYPEHVAHDYKPGHGRPERVPSDAYVARLGHERFHEWFGRVCDHTCPHLHGGRAANAAPLPLARIARAPWWRRLLAWMEPRTIRRCAHCGRVIAEDMHLLRRCESGCGRGRGAGDVCTTLVWS